VEVDEIVEGYNPEDGEFHGVMRYRCLKFAARPNHQALGSFDRREVPEGTRVTFSDPAKYQATGRRVFLLKDDQLWQKGQVVPKSRGTQSGGALSLNLSKSGGN
jgi:hypothetical protein